MENEIVTLALGFKNTFIMNCGYTINIWANKLRYEQLDCLINYKV